MTDRDQGALRDDGRRLAALGAAACAGLLAAAFAFQHIGGLAPCPLCIWQRWPHVAGAALGLAAFAAPPSRAGRLAAGAAALALAAGAALALYHVGVEQRWWQGPSTCVGGGDIGALSTAELLARIKAAPLVRCDEVAWSLAGLSMAAWNGVASAGLAGLFALAAMAFSRGRPPEAGAGPDRGWSGPARARD
jgi:disulfide bond formation protein DsbB